MVNLSRRFKLEYEDANDGTTVIAETGQDTGAPKIDRHVHIRRKNDPDILKLWLEGTDFGDSIPTDRSNFATAQNGENEPEILYKQYDRDTDSFVTQGRFYAKNSGSINEEGELAVKLYSFMRYTAKQDVNMSESNDIESAMQKVLPSGYTVVNAGNNVNIEGTYSINSTREKGYQELTRNYNFALTFTAELDNSNNYKVKYEPVGEGGTVDTLVDRDQGGRYPIVDVDTGTDTFFVSGDKTNDLVVNQAIEVDGSTGNDGTYTISSLNYDSTDNETDIAVSQNVSDSTGDGSVIPGGTTKFKSWEKDKTDSVVNRVKVEGVNTNTGNKITQTANNTATQNKVGIKSRPVIKIGYLNGTDTEAQNQALKIAKNYLVPGKDSQGNDIDELPESGRVKTTVYSDNVVNDSFQVISNRLNISDTYTVVQQRNFWPEGATELEFEFEQEALEEAARDSENLRDERARLLPSQNKGLSGQTANTAPDVNGNSGDTGPDVNGDTGDTGPNVDGVSTGSGGASEVVASQETQSADFAPTGTETTLATFTGTNQETAGGMFYITLAPYLANTREGDSGAADIQQNTLKISVLNTDLANRFPEDEHEIFTQHVFLDADNDGTLDTTVNSFHDISIYIPEDTENIDYEVRLEPTIEDTNLDFFITFSEYDTHDHSAGTYAADLHPHDDGTLDSDLHPHDDGTYGADNHPHNTGTLEAEVAEEDKTDR